MKKRYRDQSEVDECKAAAIKFLEDHRAGVLLLDLQDELEQLVTAISETNKAGSLTLTVHIKPQEEGTVVISDVIKVKKPTLPSPASLMFVTPNGRLTRSDARQQSLPIMHLEDPDPSTVTKLSPRPVARSI